MSEPGEGRPDGGDPDGDGRDHGSTRSLARSSAVMASGTLVSRLLGVVRLILLAEAIGNLTDAANVWETANTIPNTIYLLLAAGVLNILLLPQLTRAMTRGQEGQEFSDRLLTIAVTVLVVGTALFLLATPWVTKLNALGWAWEDPKLQLAILFAYICIPQMLFYGLHTVMGQVLAAHHRFAAFMWSPALANVVQILGLVLFIRRYPDAAQIPLQDWTSGMIWLLAGSATLGIVVQAIVLIPAVRASGFVWRPRWGLRGVGLGTAGAMALWAFAEVGLSQGGMLAVRNVLNVAIDQVPDAPGTNAYFYGFSIFMLPHSLLALSLLTAMYPVLSKAAAAGDLEGMAVRTSTGMKMLASAMVPIAVGLMLLAPLVVRVIYFSSLPEAQEAITAIVMAFTVGLVPYGLYLLCGRVFYSFEDAKTPFYFQIGLTATLLIAVLVALTLPPERAAMTAALGQALGQFVALGVGLWFVRRKLPTIALRPVLDTLLRALAASLLALLPAWILIRLLDRPGTAGAVLTLGVAGVVFLVVYAVLAIVLGVGEVRTVLAPLLRRVPPLRRFAPAQGSVAEAVAVASPVEEPGASGVPTPPTSASAADLGSERGTLGWDDAPEGDTFGGEDTDMDQLEVGSQLGDRYTLDELLAERESGGLQYWSARDSTLGRLVAVTVFPSTGEHALTAEAVLDGARRVASVDDPRLVRVLDVGEEDTLCWIIEEGLSEAESLASLVQDHPLPAEEVRRLIGETAAGLESARRRGLHHLYLNPHSVLRTTDGTVKISGVGVASALEGTDDVTADEASLIDAADLVSLLYTGLTGRWPGEELPGVRPARRLTDGSLPAPSELVSGVPGDLDALCRIVHGASADLAVAPHTPGELARQLSPWSPDIVRSGRPGELTPPRGDGDGDSGSRATDALTGSAGASAAATAAHPIHAKRGDLTEHVPRPNYGTGEDHLSRGDHDDAGGYAGPGAGMAGAAAGVGLGAAATDRRAERGALRTDHEGSGALGGLGSSDGPDDGLGEARASGLQTAAVLGIILAIVAIAALLGWAVMRSIGDRDDGGEATVPGAEGPADPGVATDGATEGTDDSAITDEPADDAAEDTAAPAPAAGPEGSVAIHGITSYDPEGDGDERNDLAPLAVDGDPETAWTSHTYLSQGWGSLKSGTGLILDLGEGASVSEVDVELGDGTMGTRLYLSESATHADATELGAAEEVEGTWTVTPDSPATGRYLILWFDTAASTDAGEIVSVREISVR